MSVADVVFYLTAAITLACAAYAVFSRNIVRAVFSLLGTFFGMAVLYGWLQADFLAVVQVLVYVGGILVLLLFAVMLTADISRVENTNPAGNRVLGWLAALGLAALLIPLAIQAPWINAEPAAAQPITSILGERLLGAELLAFEVISVVLLGIVIGAVVVARWPNSGEGRK